MCHEFDLWLYFQGQGHRADIAKIHVWALTLFSHISHSCWNWHKDVSWSWPRIISPRLQFIWCLIFVQLVNFQWIVRISWYLIWLMSTPNLWPNDVLWPCPIVISPKSRPKCTHSQTSCPGYSFSLASWMGMMIKVCCICSVLLLFLCPLRRRRGILRCTCRSVCRRSVGMSVVGMSVSLNLVQLITQERFAPEASNLVGR